VRVNININMGAQFNNRDNPCFHGNNLVLMADGTHKLVREIKRGDAINAGFGGMNKISYIECVVRTELDNKEANLVELYDATKNVNLLVTPWHPVLIDGAWSFPVMLSPKTLKTRPCDALYSFVVKNDSSMHYGYEGQCRSNMVIGGLQVATLGHGIKNDPIVSHEFFGTEKIIEELYLCPGDGWSHGLIRLKSGAMKRHVNDNDKMKVDEGKDHINKISGICFESIISSVNISC
jgi:hypothetical protein